MSESELMERLRARIGRREGPDGSCPYPVNEAMIHHWCDALGDRNPAYLDPEFARASSRGGVVAPPAMLQAWTMRGLRPPSRDEEAWAAAGERPAMRLLQEAGFTSVVATNCEQRYRRDVVPGDRLTHRVVLEDVSEEKRTALGVGHFMTQRYDFRDARGEVVAEMRFRMFWYRPAPARA